MHGEMSHLKANIAVNVVTSKRIHSSAIVI